MRWPTAPIADRIPRESRVGRARVNGFRPLGQHRCWCRRSSRLPLATTPLASGGPPESDGKRHECTHEQCVHDIVRKSRSTQDHGPEHDERSDRQPAAQVPSGTATARSSSPPDPARSGRSPPPGSRNSAAASSTEYSKTRPAESTGAVRSPTDDSDRGEAGAERHCASPQRQRRDGGRHRTPGRRERRRPRARRSRRSSSPRAPGRRRTTRRRRGPAERGERGEVDGRQRAGYQVGRRHDRADHEQGREQPRSGVGWWRRSWRCLDGGHDQSPSVRLAATTLTGVRVPGTRDTMSHDNSPLRPGRREARPAG